MRGKPGARLAREQHRHPIPRPVDGEDLPPHTGYGGLDPGSVGGRERVVGRRGAGGSAAKWIAIQAILDQSGCFRMPVLLGGPDDLAKVAMDAIATWRAEPARINGAPLATPVVLQVTFKTVE